MLGTYALSQGAALALLLLLLLLCWLPSLLIARSLLLLLLLGLRAVPAAGSLKLKFAITALGAAPAGGWLAKCARASGWRPSNISSWAASARLHAEHSRAARHQMRS
jgi:hypothetical protein